MTKAQLIAQMAGDADVTQKQAQEALESLFAQLTKTIKSGDSITLPGLGSFSVVKRKARKGRNPRTGEEIKIAASKSVKFKPSQTLKNELNK
jgi:DNA-binding protein HU-beta